MTTEDIASLTFPYLQASGNARTIGFELGQKLSSKIKDNHKIYHKQFLKIGRLSGLTENQTEQTITELVSFYTKQVKDTFPELHEEIVACASGSDLALENLYLLNSRTEIFHAIKASKKVAECTAIYSAQNKLLAQNWDWMPELEQLSFIAKLCPANKPQIITLTEPGILAKIGINSEGLGVCLNILFAESEIKGLPVHIILRALLECSDSQAALKLLRSIPLGTNSNIMIADRTGQAFNIEIKGSDIIEYECTDQNFVHTNHYLQQDPSDESIVPGSVDRYQRACVLAPEYLNEGISGVKKILADREGKFPICRKYAKGSYFKVGTVAATIADLQKTELHVCRGQPSELSNWHVYRF